MMLILTTGAALIASAPIAFAAQADVKSSFTKEQKAELDVLLRQFVNDNPELIMESFRQFQEDQEEKAEQSAQESLERYKEGFADRNLPMVGNPDGDVTVVEFFDYNCRYCVKAFEDIMKFIEEDKNIRVVLLDMPILSQSSQIMATIGLAANKQGKYFEMHKALMEYSGSQSEEAFLTLAKDIGLDIEQLKKDMNSAEIKSMISKNRAMSHNLGIQGTPGFVVGDRIYPGYIGKNGLRKAVKEAREVKTEEKKVE